MTKTNQIKLIAEIVAELSRQGIRDLTIRKFNAAIRAVNDIIAAVERDDRPTEPGEGLQGWLAGDDTGASSRYMAYILAGGPTCQRSFPHDPADFGRCYRFLRAVPDTQRQSFLDMARYGPVWAGLIANWAELSDLWREESPGGDCPRLYRRMQEIIAEGGEKF